MDSSISIDLEGLVRDYDECVIMIVVSQFGIVASLKLQWFMNVLWLVEVWNVKHMHLVCFINKSVLLYND